MFPGLGGRYKSLEGVPFDKEYLFTINLAYPKTTDMERRIFFKNTALTAIAISTCGYIRLDGEKYVGDCETTTDILGPFYRPDSPIRNNFILEGQTGKPVELSGFIRHKDCTTPYKNAKIELWHCDPKGIYDNHSPSFLYRGTGYSDNEGFYSFRTLMPVAYDAAEGVTRPAHFHLMITADGYQPLVTQLYFTGDAHIKKDPYASSPKASKRILNVQKMKDGSVKVVYDITMSEVLHLEAATIDKLSGIYKEQGKGEKTAELFKHNNTLWKKNEAFGDKFEYAGNNTFKEANNPGNLYWKLQFEILPSGAIELTESFIDTDMSKKVFHYTKEN
jgi:catechol 1,2-dioxygenase